MNIIDIPSSIYTSFNNVIYYDEPHKYYHDNHELISVTTLLHKYEEPFDEIKWSEIKANEFGLSPYEILRAWRFINDKGTMKGSIIHNYTENLFLNKKFPYPKQDIYNHFGFDPIYDEYIITKKHVNNFYKDVKNKLIPIRTETIIYDNDALVGGMFDILFYNVKAQEFQIWDWKTNKAFEMKSSRKLLNKLYMLDNCDYEIYSLQLAMYKFIIEKITGIKLG
jgi:hypothetical protein